MNRTTPSRSARFYRHWPDSDSRFVTVGNEAKQGGFVDRMRTAALSFAGDYRSGIWWLRIFGRGVSLHAPWKRPLFSERNGLRWMLRLGAGWRVEWLQRAEVE